MENTTVVDLKNSYKVRFLPEKAVGKNFVMHFDISGEGGLAFSVIVNNGELNIVDGLEGEAGCVLSASAENYILVETGQLNATTAMFTGKIKASNLLKVPEFTQMFRGYVSVKKEGLL